MSDKVVIVAAGRTAIGTFGGSLAGIPAHSLGATVISGVLEQAGLKPDQVDEVIFGHVLTAGTGQNPARQAAIAAGIPETTPSMTINKVCGSGLKAVHLAAQAIMCGDADIIVAGGQENMSLSPHVLPKSRDGQKMGDWKMQDSMIVDGLWDAFNDYHMGVTAENIAKEFNISRDEQDEFAAASQNKTEAAQEAGKFDDEIIPVDLNDGAAAVVVMSESKAKELGIKPLATIAAYSSAGVSPTIMGTGPIPATEKCLEKAGWTHEDLDLIEANEAFAAQAISVNKGLGWDTAKVNVSGGAIALGHPIGASGCRVLVTLLHEMKRSDAKKGLATLCIGGGQGVALAVER